MVLTSKIVAGASAGAETIEFYINEGGTVATYQARDGMTFEEWCGSSYNTSGYYASTYAGLPQIYNSAGTERLRGNSADVYWTTVIEAGSTYYWN